MRNAARSIAGVAIVLAAAGFSAQGSAQPAPEEVCVNCYHPQSPRRLTAADWNWTSRTPTVSRRSADSILYSPRAGVPALVLHACSQHYHCRIENLQNCPGQSASPIPDLTECPEHPPVGSWVEIHTAYHQGPALHPLPEGLEGCHQPGALAVVGYHAKVTSEQDRLPRPDLLRAAVGRMVGVVHQRRSPTSGTPRLQGGRLLELHPGVRFQVEPETARGFRAPGPGAGAPARRSPEP